ncbi:MAG: ABC transporter permease subunit [Saprospiraceae bacterium]|jgi:NitT/TauT family transport system permease protein|nr:ABC transporter permease subunit [Saprospiraceae bacterium]MBK6477495.1 ABC transporter permease subunit [Saprospiraceae bacterium]MBK6816630.1 ABC transporter permease subunit [Saprospiraceae bacterium]MBK7371157.1 ABC transporter permease subunit [Saprospiraceae bacterium]MBK8281227.1 ABC transporter permease subunit [Saprospiraceae bacterium]
MKDWFKLRGDLEGSSKYIATAIGFVLTILLWWVLAEIFSKNRPIYPGEDNTTMELIDSTSNQSKVKLWDAGAKTDDAAAVRYEKVYPLLPRPDQTLLSFKALFTKDNLVGNTLHSCWLNLQGYFWAILLALPFGMFLSLFPVFKVMFARQVDAMRYLPLSALTGLFIIWFGLGDSMKIAFLAVGIIVYLVPVVMQRIKEVEDNMLQTSYTMGATAWQQIKKVYIPASLSHLIDDIRVLTAISWTYIIIAELLNKETGIGALIYTKARLGQTDRVFAILIVITLVGLFQDQLFQLIDKIINPHKYYKSRVDGLSDASIGFMAWVAAIIIGILAGMFPAVGIMKYGAWILGAAGTLFFVLGFFKINKANQ